MSTPHVYVCVYVYAFIARVARRERRGRSELAKIRCCSDVRLVRVENLSGFKTGALSARKTDGDGAVAFDFRSREKLIGEGVALRDVSGRASVLLITKSASRNGTGKSGGCLGFWILDGSGRCGSGVELGVE